MLDRLKLGRIEAIGGRAEFAGNSDLAIFLAGFDFLGAEPLQHVADLFTRAAAAVEDRARFVDADTALMEQTEQQPLRANKRIGEFIGVDGFDQRTGFDPGIVLAMRAVAGVAVFLASDDARWLTGERLAASGGFR